jgi:anaerobic ribonucleoside-triphosphate reductase activating protein
MLNVNGIFKIEYNVLGPFERVGVWFQGCSIRCKNCFVPELWSFKPNKMFSANELFKEVEKFKLKEITLSGGEPFDQDKKEFYKFLKILRKNEYGIWVYSGYTIEELIERGFYKHLKLIDVLVDGRYVDDLNNNEVWKGSSNQRIILLTNRYKNIALERNRKLQFIVVNNEFFVIGIPKRNFWKKFYSLITD